MSVCCNWPFPLPPHLPSVSSVSVRFGNASARLHQRVFTPVSRPISLCATAVAVPPQDTSVSTARIARWALLLAGCLGSCRLKTQYVAPLRCSGSFTQAAFPTLVWISV